MCIGNLICSSISQNCAYIVIFTEEELIRAETDDHSKRKVGYGEGIGANVKSSSFVWDDRINGSHRSTHFYDSFLHFETKFAPSGGEYILRPNRKLRAYNIISLSIFVVVLRAPSDDEVRIDPL